MSKKAIPWKLGDSEIISVWVWETDHFKASINTDQHRRNFMWNITDVSQGYESSLQDGHTSSFDEAERFVKEIVGKSYPPQLGYQDFAGREATTFVIFTNEKIDFGPLQAAKVILTVRMPDNKGGIKEQRIIGKLSIDHYSIKIAPDHGSIVKIPPSRILKVQPEFGSAIKPVKEEDTVAKSLRIYKGAYTKGCTGKPGFLANTVEHAPDAPRCPIHEVGA